MKTGSCDLERKPYFLIRGMSPALRDALEEDAQAAGLPIQETLRRILCAHYDLDCSPINGMLRKDAWGDATTILVKMQPELFFALKEDAAETGESMQALVHQALEGHYAVTGGTPV